MVNMPFVPWICNGTECDTVTKEGPKSENMFDF